MRSACCSTFLWAACLCALLCTGPRPASAIVTDTTCVDHDDAPLVRLEAGLGLGFLALIIGYLPGMNQSFANREEAISLLDARAGSPPTALEMLRRHGPDNGLQELERFLNLWERWSSELLESHLSYPVLAYFRSQHDNESWLAALTAYS